MKTEHCNTNDFTPLKDIPSGDGFSSGEFFYIKTSETPIEGSCRVVCANTGLLITYPGSLVVRHQPNAKIVF